MGTGFHGGFGKTKGAIREILRKRFSLPKRKKLFTRVQFQGTVVVNGKERDVSRRVYQRQDIDFNYRDPKSGKTNLEYMREGRAPIGNDGKPIQLHHVVQKEVGPIVEIRAKTHRTYSRQLHRLIEPGSSFRRNDILRVQYNKFREAYWKWRAEEYEKGISYE